MLTFIGLDRRPP